VREHHLCSATALSSMLPWQHIMSGAGWVHLYAIYVAKLCCFVKPSQWNTHASTVDVARGRACALKHTRSCVQQARAHTRVHAYVAPMHLMVICPEGRPVCPHVQAQTSLAVLLSYCSSALSDEHCTLNMLAKDVGVSNKVLPLL
jgi:hypothetical protein